jgi:hypothetical protein
MSNRGFLGRRSDNLLGQNTTSMSAQQQGKISLARSCSHTICMDSPDRFPALAAQICIWCFSAKWEFPCLG